MAKLADAVVSASYVVALVLFLTGSAMTALGKLWVAQLGGLSSVSLACASALYALSAHRFRGFGVSPAKAVVLALLFANAFLQSYEIVYGLSFVPPLTGTEVRTILLWFLMVSPLILVRDYLRLTRVGLLLIGTFAALWAVWLLYGFPQYYFEGDVFPPVFQTADPYHLSLWLNFGSKAMLALFYAALLEPLKSLGNLVHRGR